VHSLRPTSNEMPASQGFQWRGSERLRVDIFDAGRLFEIASHEERYEIGNSDLNRMSVAPGKTAANSLTTICLRTISSAYVCEWGH
jgi:hypothetical protein